MSGKARACESTPKEQPSTGTRHYAVRQDEWVLRAAGRGTRTMGAGYLSMSLVRDRGGHSSQEGAAPFTEDDHLSVWQVSVSSYLEACGWVLAVRLRDGGETDVQVQSLHRSGAKTEAMI